MDKVNLTSLPIGIEEAKKIRIIHHDGTDIKPLLKEIYTIKSTLKETSFILTSDFITDKILNGLDFAIEAIPVITFSDYLDHSLFEPDDLDHEMDILKNHICNQHPDEVSYPDVEIILRKSGDGDIMFLYGRTEMFKNRMTAPCFLYGEPDTSNKLIVNDNIGKVSELTGIPESVLKALSELKV